MFNFSRLSMLALVGLLALGAWALWKEGGQPPEEPAAPSARRLTPPWPEKGAGAAAVAADLFAKNYYVVLDASSSMNERGCSGNLTKFEAARGALADFARSIPQEANLGLQVFDRSGVREWLPLGAGNRERFNEALRRAVANGATPLQSSIRQAYAKLMEQGARQLGYGEYHLVMVTDGEAYPQSEDPTAAVNALLEKSPVVLHTIGFCIGENHSLNQPGRTLYRAADNPQQLRAGLAEVLAEAPAFQIVKFGK